MPDDQVAATPSNPRERLVRLLCAGATVLGVHHEDDLVVVTVGTAAGQKEVRLTPAEARAVAPEV